jgi:hypothetical protein
MSDTQKSDWSIGYSIAQNEVQEQHLFCNTKEEIMSDNTIPNEITPNDTIDNLFVTGNVGIGIEEPGPATARLELKSQESQIGTIKLFPNSGAGRDFSYDGGTDNVFVFSHYGQEEGITQFIWDNGASARRLLTIKNTGNIGIGTADFSLSLNKTQLHVEGKLIYSGGSLGGLSFGNRDTSGFVESPTQGERWTWYSSGGTARLWSGGDKLSVNANGKVGIGTTEPVQYARLTIQDAAVPLAFRESDRAVTEGGLWRMPLDAGTLRFDVNTSASGNFSPYISTLSLYPNGDIRVARDIYANRNVYANGNVGIGTTNPQYGRLTIEDSAVPLAFRESDRAVTEGGLWRMPLDAGMLRFDVNTSASGNFSPSIPPLSMYPNGDIRVGQAMSMQIAMSMPGILLTSSRELKENIAELSGKEAVEALKNLNPVKFNFKADSDKNRHIGFIAEDVPELVATSDRKTLSPMDIVAVLTQALKEQQNTISALAEKVKLLEAKTA